jgi:L-iditol 2-dehydrogenase
MAQDFAQADGVIDMTEPIDLQTVLSQYTPHGYGFDVVIEAVGQTHTWEMALNLVRRGGLVNLFGGCESGSTMALDTRRLHYDEITLVSPFHHTPRHVKEALEWINSGMIDPTPLITHERSLSQVPEALNLVASGTALKVAIRP